MQCNLIGSIVAYWDRHRCGPDQDDNSNWSWCDTRRGGPCKKEIATNKCDSGLATLQAVYGDQFAKRPNYRNYKLNGCQYTYYAVYRCSGITKYIYKTNPYLIFITIK